jgi:Protein of unknown function (DUF3810)
MIRPSIFKDYKVRKNLLVLLAIIVFIVLVQLAWQLSFFRIFYFEKLYPAISHKQRAVFGILPFSIGDIIYFGLAIAILLWLIRLIKYLIHAKVQQKNIFLLFIRAIITLAIIYSLFIIFWGFNYHINRLKKSFGIQLEKYSKADLDSLCLYLMQQVNASHDSVTHNPDDSSTFYFTPHQLFTEAIKNYQHIALGNPSLTYHFYAVKPTMYGYWMDYLGVEGYYNPFTGEAQMNTTIPAVLQPFVVCHEISHQLGFAQEYAANFVGYYVASQSDDPRFVYSANFEVLLYAMQELHFRDSAAVRYIWNHLDTGVKKDFDAVRFFYMQFNNPVNPMMARVYDQYLKANDQKNGIHSYDEVVALLIDYRKKYH